MVVQAGWGGGRTRHAPAYLKMPDAIFYLLSEVIAFHLGRFCLGVLTLGRYKPKIGDTSQPLVSLFGGLVGFVLVIGLAIALHAS